MAQEEKVRELEEDFCLSFWNDMQAWQCPDLFLLLHRYELGRQPANTKLSTVNVTVRPVRVRGGNLKFRALRLDAGNFSWGSEVYQVSDLRDCLDKYELLCLLLLQAVHT